MATWDDFSTAQRTREAMAKVAREEINRQRPAPRYAVVQSIDMDDRSIMGVFVGESEAVRIPFLDVIPSTVGQEVRVTGVGSDRVVDGIRGTSDSESRVAALEAENILRAPRFAEWTRGSDATIGSGVTKMVWPTQPFYPVGFAVLGAGESEITIPESGYYEIVTRVTLSGDTQKDIYIQVLPVTGSNYDIGQASRQFTDASVPNLTQEVTAKGYLYIGDRVCVNVGVTSANTTVFGGIRSTFGIKKLYGGDLQLAP